MRNGWNGKNHEPAAVMPAPMIPVANGRQQTTCEATAAAAPSAPAVLHLPNVEALTGGRRERGSRRRGTAPATARPVRGRTSRGTRREYGRARRARDAGS